MTNIIKKALVVIVFVFIGVVGYLIGLKQNMWLSKRQLFNQDQTYVQPTDEKLSIVKPLSTLTKINITKDCDLYVVINSDSVWVDPFEKECSNYNFSIEKNQYPKLFEQGTGDSNFISVERNIGKNLVLTISNNQPNHGGYLPVYQLSVDLNNREIKEINSDSPSN